MKHKNNQQKPYMRTLHTAAAALVMGTMMLMAWGCGGSRKGQPPESRYRREPIKEVSESQLAIDSKLIDALSLQESGRTEEALQAYADLVQAEPACGAAWYGMARLLLQRGWTDSARACIAQAVKADGENLWYLREQAEVQERQGDHKGKVATWQRIVALEPGVVAHCYELSNACIDAGDVEGAVEALNRVERMIGVSEPISLQKQRLWLAVGNTAKAEREIVALADAMPHEKRYSAMLAEMNMERKRYSKAKAYYDRVLAADPDDEYIHVQLAEYYKRIGQTEKADDELQLAFANPRLDCRTKMQLLGSFYTSEEFYGSHSAAAFALVEQAVKDCDDASEYALLYADVLMRQERYAEAEQQLKLALSEDSSRYEVWEALLICLGSSPESEKEMLTYARRAGELFPLHTLPRYLQALACMREEDYAGALPHLEQAERWGFNKQYLEAETYMLMAEAYYRTGKYDKAWRAFDRYLELHPDDWTTMNNYAYYLAEQGIRLEEALEMSRRTIEAEPDEANSLDTYAWLLHLLGRDREALPYMEKAARLDPESDTLRHHLEVIKTALQ
ncbi:MAG: tetratricopeptide repeat protein [Bacteroidales bacterium]|nr:tetratricopeptide repeat protein [Bacteroidales bacterium]